jgi:hypothetical protein
MVIAGRGDWIDKNSEAKIKQKTKIEPEGRIIDWVVSNDLINNSTQAKQMTVTIRKIHRFSILP